jgi:hypothetical protein
VPEGEGDKMSMFLAVVSLIHVSVAITAGIIGQENLAIRGLLMAIWLMAGAIYLDMRPR